MKGQRWMFSRVFEVELGFEIDEQQCPTRPCRPCRLLAPRGSATLPCTCKGPALCLLHSLPHPSLPSPALSKPPLPRAAAACTAARAGCDRAAAARCWPSQGPGAATALLLNRPAKPQRARPCLATVTGAPLYGRLGPLPPQPRRCWL